MKYELLYLRFIVMSEADSGVNLTGALHSNFGFMGVVGGISMKVGFMR